MSDFLSTITDPVYKHYCRKIYNGRFLHEDLYQEFILIMLEKPKEQMILLTEKNKLRNYCFGVITMLFRIRGRKKSLLNEITSKIDISEFNIEFESHDYNGFDEVKYNKVTKILQKSSEDELLILSLSLNKGVKTFCKQAEISYHTVRINNSKFKKEIKKQCQ